MPIQTGDIDKVIQSAKDNADKKGVQAGSVTAVIQAETPAGDRAKVSINLPRVVQQKVIDNKIENLMIVVNRPDISVNLNLPAIRSIYKQAGGDANVTAERISSGRFSEAVRKVLGNRPIFDLKVTAVNNNTTISNFENGYVSVEIPYTAQQEENAGSLAAVYVDEKGNTHYLIHSSYDMEKKVMRIRTGHFSVYGIGQIPAAAFADIQNHAAKEDIIFAQSRGLVAGTSSTKFQPDAAITRGDFITALGKMAEINPEEYKKSATVFTDLDDTKEYAAYAKWAEQKGIVSKSAKFSANQPLSRKDMASMLEKYVAAAGIALGKNRKEISFKDISSLTAPEKAAITRLQQSGIINGFDDNQFKPAASLTRGEACAVLRRMIEVSITPEAAQGWSRNASNHWEYYQGGAKVSGWKTVDGKRYFFEVNGVVERQ